MTAYRYWRLQATRWVTRNETDAGVTTEVGSENAFGVSRLQYVVGGVSYPTVELTSNTTPEPYAVYSHDNWYRAFQGFKTDVGYRWNAFPSSTVPRALTIDMGAAYSFEEVRLSSDDPAYANTFMMGFDILASETGQFAGEEVVRLSYLNGGVDSIWAGTYPEPVTFLFGGVQGAGTATANVALPSASVYIVGGGPASATTDVALPTAGIYMSSGASAGSELPGLAFSAIAHGLNGADLRLPSPTARATGGAGAAALVPALVGAARGGANSQFGLPMLSAYGTGSEGIQSKANLVLPALFATAFGGVITSSTLPALATFATATFYGWAQSLASLPALQVDVAGTPGVIGGVATALPMFGAAGNGGANASASLASLIVFAGTTVGGTATAFVTLPRLLAGLVGTRQATASVNVTLPMLRAVNSGVLRLTLPALAAVSAAYAVVNYTYEAYAVNLNHKEHPGIIPTDEVTRYTNFPFDKIIRFKGGYYGVSANGLFLLGGDTDAGTPIPWAWKTFEDDFKVPQKKTLVSAYLSGRIGPAMVLTLYAGEKGGVGYSYTSPRGPDVQNYRQVFGRGIQSRYFALGAAGTSAFTLDTLDFDSITLSRRI